MYIHSRTTKSLTFSPSSFLFIVLLYMIDKFEFIYIFFFAFKMTFAWGTLLELKICIYVSWIYCG